MDEEISQIIETLEMLVEDLPQKARFHMEDILKSLKKMDDCIDANCLMKIQDDLEVITNIPSVDNYSRNEIMNAIAVIESIYNS